MGLTWSCLTGGNPKDKGWAEQTQRADACSAPGNICTSLKNPPPHSAPQTLPSQQDFSSCDDKVANILPVIPHADVGASSRHAATLTPQPSHASAAPAESAQAPDTSTQAPCGVAFAVHHTYEGVRSTTTAAEPACVAQDSAHMQQRDRARHRQVGQGLDSALTTAAREQVGDKGAVGAAAQGIPCHPKQLVQVQVTPDHETIATSGTTDTATPATQGELTVLGGVSAAQRLSPQETSSSSGGQVAVWPVAQEGHLAAIPIQGHLSAHPATAALAVDGVMADEGCQADVQAEQEQAGLRGAAGVAPSHTSAAARADQGHQLAVVAAQAEQFHTVATGPAQASAAVRPEQEGQAAEPGYISDIGGTADLHDSFDPGQVDVMWADAESASHPVNLRTGILMPPNEQERRNTMVAMGADGAAKCPELDCVLDALCRVTDMPYGCVSLYYNRCCWLVSTVGMLGGRIPWTVASCPWNCLVKQPQTIASGDVLQDARLTHKSWIALGLRCYCSGPLLASNGHVLGAICVCDSVPRRVDLGMCRIINNFAELAIRVLERHLQLVQRLEAARQVVPGHLQGLLQAATKAAPLPGSSSFGRPMLLPPTRSCVSEGTGLQPHLGTQQGQLGSLQFQPGPQQGPSGSMQVPVASQQGVPGSQQGVPGSQQGSSLRQQMQAGSGVQRTRVQLPVTGMERGCYLLEKDETQQQAPQSLSAYAFGQMQENLQGQSISFSETGTGAVAVAPAPSWGYTHAMQGGQGDMSRSGVESWSSNEQLGYSAPAAGAHAASELVACSAYSETGAAPKPPWSPRYAASPPKGNQGVMQPMLHASAEPTSSNSRGKGRLQERVLMSLCHDDTPRDMALSPVPESNSDSSTPASTPSTSTSLPQAKPADMLLARAFARQIRNPQALQDACVLVADTAVPGWPIIFADETWKQWAGFSRQDIMGHKLCDVLRPSAPGVAPLNWDALQAEADTRQRFIISSVMAVNPSVPETAVNTSAIQAGNVSRRWTGSGIGSFVTDGPQDLDMLPMRGSTRPSDPQEPDAGSVTAADLITSAVQAADAGNAAFGPSKPQAGGPAGSAGSRESSWQFSRGSFPSQGASSGPVSGQNVEALLGEVSQLEQGQRMAVLQRKADEAARGGIELGHAAAGVLPSAVTSTTSYDDITSKSNTMVLSRPLGSGAGTPKTGSAVHLAPAVSTAATVPGSMAQLAAAASAGRPFDLSFRPMALDAMDEDTLPVSVPSWVELQACKRTLQVYVVRLHESGLLAPPPQPLAPSMKVVCRRSGHVSQLAAYLFPGLELGQVLGRGGYGTAYLAMWHGVTVVVKVQDYQLDDLQELRDAQLEVSLGQMLRHPHLVRTLAHGSAELPDTAAAAKYRQKSIAPAYEWEAMQHYVVGGDWQPSHSGHSKDSTAQIADSTLSNVFDKAASNGFDSQHSHSAFMLSPPKSLRRRRQATAAAEALHNRQAADTSNTSGRLAAQPAGSPAGVAGADQQAWLPVHWDEDIELSEEKWFCHCSSSQLHHRTMTSKYLPLAEGGAMGDVDAQGHSRNMGLEADTGMTMNAPAVCVSSATHDAAACASEQLSLPPPQFMVNAASIAPDAQCMVNNAAGTAVDAQQQLAAQGGLGLGTDTSQRSHQIVALKPAAIQATSSGPAQQPGTSHFFPLQLCDEDQDGGQFGGFLGGSDGRSSGKGKARRHHSTSSKLLSEPPAKEYIPPTSQSFDSLLHLTQNQTSSGHALHTTTTSCRHTAAEGPSWAQRAARSREDAVLVRHSDVSVEGAVNAPSSTVMYVPAMIRPMASDHMPMALEHKHMALEHRDMDTQSGTGDSSSALPAAMHGLTQAKVVAGDMQHGHGGRAAVYDQSSGSHDLSGDTGAKVQELRDKLQATLRQPTAAAHVPHAAKHAVHAVARSPRGKHVQDSSSRLGSQARLTYTLGGLQPSTPRTPISGTTTTATAPSVAQPTATGSVTQTTATEDIAALLKWAEQHAERVRAQPMTFPLHLRTFAILEYCNGGTLQDAIDRGWLRAGSYEVDAPPDMPKVVSLGRDIVQAVADLHARGVVHADLSAANVLLCRHLTTPTQSLDHASSAAESNKNTGITADSTGKDVGAVFVQAVHGRLQAPTPALDARGIDTQQQRNHQSQDAAASAQLSEGCDKQPSGTRAGAGPGAGAGGGVGRGQVGAHKVPTKEHTTAPHLPGRPEDLQFTAKISDFGKCRLLGPEGVVQAGSYATITHCAPEVLNTYELSAAADIYAVGMLMWQMYTGSRPWPGLSHCQMIAVVVSGSQQLYWPEPHDMNLPAQQADAAKAWIALGKRCLSHAHTLRPTAMEAEALLKGIQAQLQLLH